MTKLDRELFLEVSPIKADGGNKVGKLPAFIEVSQLRALRHPESPILAIRSKCLDCCGGVASEVRKCVAVTCSLWPHRMGSNPFHGKKALAEHMGPISDESSAPCARTRTEDASEI